MRILRHILPLYRATRHLHHHPEDNKTNSKPKVSIGTPEADKEGRFSPMKQFLY
jgi:hypothetical protein